MKRFKLLIIPILLCFLLSGCNGSLSDYAVVEAVGIDNKDNKTNVSLQYLNLSKSTGATDSLSNNITAVVSGKSYNIIDAIHNASKSLSQRAFFGQNKLIVFGFDYIKDGFSSSLVNFLCASNCRPDVVVVASKTSALDVIKCTQQDARIPAESIYNLLESGEHNGTSALVSVNDLLRLYNSKTSDVFLPVVKVKKNVASVSEIALFSDNKYTTSIKNNVALSFLLAYNNVDNASMLLSSKKLGKIAINITSAKAKKYVTVSNTTPTFHFEITLDAVVSDSSSLSQPNAIQNHSKEIENLVNKRLKGYSIKLFDVLAQSKSDPLEIGKYLAKADLDLYNDLKDNWRDNLSKIDYKVSIKTNLTNP